MHYRSAAVFRQWCLSVNQRHFQWPPLIHSSTGQVSDDLCHQSHHCVQLSQLLLTSSSKQSSGTKTMLKRNEPCHEIMVLFVLHKLILQMHLWSSSGARRLIFGQTLRLLPYITCANSKGSGETVCGCAGSPEPSLVAYVISTCTIISWAGSNIHYSCNY